VFGGEVIGNGFYAAKRNLLADGIVHDPDGHGLSGGGLICFSHTNPIFIMVGGKMAAFRRIDGLRLYTSIHAE